MERESAIKVVKELISKYEEAIVAQRPVAEKARKTYQRLVQRYGFDWELEKLSKASKDDTIEGGILYDLECSVRALTSLLDRKWGESDVIAKERLEYYQHKLVNVRKENENLFKK